MKKEGFDDGIFDLLDNIETKVKKGFDKDEYKNRSLKKDNYGQNEEEDEFDEEDNSSEEENIF